MSDRRAAHPGLYPAEGSRPPLYGQRCSACSRVTFPPNPYGCEVCGAAAESLETQELAGSGTLRAFATVHLHPGMGGIQAPFTVASIALDDGPSIRATLTCPTDEALSVGDRVHSVLVPQGTDGEGNETVELRFEPEGGA